MAAASGARRSAAPLLGLLLALQAAPAASTVVGSWSIVDPGQGPVALPDQPAELSELSGISWLEGASYLAVSDAGGRLFGLEIPIDPDSGAIVSVTASGPLALADGVDLEGVAYDALTGRVLASDESGPAIRIHAAEDGATVDVVPIPAIFALIRSNFGLESLTLGPRSSVDRSLYTANEEALSVDGPLSSFEQGTLVRLQRFDESALDPEPWTPAAQWAYLTDPIEGRSAGGPERSGVVELMHLPTAGVLVLERSFGAGVGFRARIYVVDVTGATETSAIDSFEQTPPVPITKTLLHESTSPVDNYEGLALGPQLANGDYALLLVADNQGLFANSVRSLRLVQVPETGAGSLALGLAALLALGRGRRFWHWKITQPRPGS